jgi:hypothetical protein
MRVPLRDAEASDPISQLHTQRLKIEGCIEDAGNRVTRAVMEARARHKGGRAQENLT